MNNPLNDFNNGLTPPQVAEIIRDTAEARVQGLRQLIVIVCVLFFAAAAIGTGIIYIPIASELAGYNRDGKRIETPVKKQVENPAFVSPSNPYGESSKPATEKQQPATEKTKDGEKYPAWIFWGMIGIVAFIIFVLPIIRQNENIHSILSANQNGGHGH
mgnify:CR=1 FL=1